MTPKHFAIDSTLGLTDKPPDKNEPKEKAEEHENLLLAKSFNIGYYLVTPILIGVFFGVGLDHIFHTKPMFTIGLLLFGVVGTFYNIFKLTDATH